MNAAAPLPAALAAIRAGRWQEAARLAQQARAAAPKDAGVPLALAEALAAAGKPLDALTLRLSAWRLDPAAHRVRLALARGFAGIRLTEASPLVEEALLALLDTPDLDPQEVAPTAASLVAAGGAEAALARPLGRRLLLRALIAEPSLEAELTALRRAALLGEPFSTEALVPLAAQAALGCHAWAEDAAECEEVEALAARLSAAPPAGWTREVLLLAAYRPLPAWAARLGRPADPETLLLHQRLVEQPARAAVLAVGLPSLTPTEDATSRAVKAQYEANPYPRWIGVTRQAPRPLAEVLRGLFPDQTPPENSAPRVLVAGCGTGAHALRVAARYAGAEVLAVDLSRASLGYAAMMAETLGARSLAFAEADILALGGLAERFELIECSGVLHHLADPAAGLAVLRGLLAPGGVMKLGLYARRGRRAIQAARDFAAGLGEPMTPAGLRRVRQALLALPAAHPAAPATRLLDFQSLDGLRDLVLHVQEATFDPPGLARLLDGAGLGFLGFEIADPAILAAFRREHPARERDLAAWEAFEAANPDSFTTMYQFWARAR